MGAELPADAAALCAGMRRLEALGLNRGTAGNLSVRSGAGLLITPSGVAPAALEPRLMVLLAADGTAQADAARPSSEWRIHHDIYRARPDAGAVVHVHSPYATALACQRRELPPFHYMIAVAGGSNVRCAPYALFGTQALSDAAIAALDGRRACLLANHGMITLGADLDSAIGLAIEVEELARQYNLSCAYAEPTHLTSVQMDAVIEQFKDYGAGNRGN